MSVTYLDNYEMVEKIHMDYALLGEYKIVVPLTFTPPPLEIYVEDEPTKLEFLEII